MDKMAPAMGTWNFHRELEAAGGAKREPTARWSEPADAALNNHHLVLALSGDDEASYRTAQGDAIGTAYLTDLSRRSGRSHPIGQSKQGFSLESDYIIRHHEA